MALHFAGRLVLAGLLSGVGFVMFIRAGEYGLAPGFSMAGGVTGWFALAWAGVIVVDMAVRRAEIVRKGVAPPRLLQDLARVVFFAAAILAILAFVFGQPVGGLLATSGLVVAVIGFALRGIIADVFSGIAINMEHPYRIGDWVQLDGGQVGRVAEINWRATRLITRDDTSLVVPNGMIAGAKLINFSFPSRHYRASLRLALPADLPVERARRVLLAAVLGTEQVSGEPRSEVHLEGFDERGATYVVRYWVSDFADDNLCRDAVAASIATALQRAGITVAAPRREINVLRRRQEGGPDELHRQPLFRHFDAEELGRLSAHMVERRFHEGERLFTEGDRGGSLFLLSEGVLEVRVRTPDGEAVLDRMVPGEVLGEISLLTGQPRSASAVGLTDGIVYELGRQALEPILRARPELAEDLAALMARRQRHNLEKLAARQTQAEPPAEAGDLLVRLRAFFRL